LRPPLALRARPSCREPAPRRGARGGPSRADERDGRWRIFERFVEVLVVRRLIDRPVVWIGLPEPGLDRRPVGKEPPEAAAEGGERGQDHSAVYSPRCGVPDRRGVTSHAPFALPSDRPALVP